jgi:hypothetical protein
LLHPVKGWSGCGLERSSDAFAGYGYDPSLVNARVRFSTQDANMREVDYARREEGGEDHLISNSTSAVNLLSDRLVWDP